MADWDVIGAAPAQVQDPWAVRSMAPAPTTTGNVVKGVGDAALSGASKVATTVAGAPIALVNRLIAALSGGDPQMAADAAHEYVNRNFGYDTQTPVGKRIGAAVHAALAPLGESAQAGSELLQQGGEAIGIPRGETHGALSELGDIAGTAGAVAPIAAGAGASTEAAALAANNATRTLGLRTAEDAPIARSIAGPSGREALTLQNQKLGNTVAGAQAGVPHGTDLGYDALEEARGAPNAVYGRVAQNLPTAPLSPTAAQAIQGAGGANRITQGTPDAITNIQTLKDQLLAPGRSFTGDQVVNESRGLRQESGTNIASDDVSKQQLGKAQLDMARGLEQHIADSLPPNGTTSLDQFQGARTALAKNYAVQSALRGPHVDLQALARVQRSDPGLLTGDMKTLADFANDHPEVSSLPSAGTRYAPPGLGKDLGQVDIINPRSWIQPFLGKLARRSLTGNPADALAAARAAPVVGLAGEFDPIDRTPQAPPWMTASTPTAPPPAAPGPPGQIPLADVLAHGVEQSPAPELTAGPMGAPPSQGIPFTPSPELVRMAPRVSPPRAIFQNGEEIPTGLGPEPQAPRVGDQTNELSLDEGLNGPFKGQPMSMADFAGVKSQGVPEGIMTRTPAKPKFQAGDVIKPPEAANNASGQTPVSEEFANAQEADKAAGVTRSVINPDGQRTPISGVAARDLGVQGSTAGAAVPKGHLGIEERPGQPPRIVNRGGLSQSAAQGLLNRYLAQRLGETF